MGGPASFENASKPAFGSTSSLGTSNAPTFGSSTAFGTSGFGGNSATPFGQTNISPSKPFGQGFVQANNNFGSLANQGSIFDKEANNQSGENVFGGSTTNSFGGTNSNSFGQSSSSNRTFTDYR
ncbi:hypothetical protein K7432_017635 [Basidiobolus ranarum]|uniref:Uncharacterized protein n=1 Tax=Basidiobolus ranarum TaxID=34480 RepID=A0ABR2VK29_9FUNG